MTPKPPSPVDSKVSLAEIPEDIRAQVAIVQDLVHKTVKKHVAMIWLFGSYARGEAISDRRVNPKTGVLSEYDSDVDILVVVGGKHTMQKEGLWRKLDQTIEAHPDITTNIHLIRESVKRVSEALLRSEYFYLDVIKEGILLYSDGTALPTPKELSVEDRRALSIQYLERFYSRVDASKISLELLYQVGNLSSSMYCLHQLGERLFYTYLLVFTHYKPRSHKLAELRERAATINPEITQIFPLNNEQEKTSFKFLDDAYVDSRYKDDYEVDLNVMDYLIEQMAKFQQWVLTQSLRNIDNLIPERNYSDNYSPPGTVLDLHTLKNKKVPQTVIYEQLETIKKLELREKKLLEKLRDAGLDV